ncbi:MAG: SemiSWEET transporter [Bacteroidota bacterium]
MDFLQILGLTAGICTASSMIPQLVTTVKKKKAEQVSLLMFLVLMLGNGLWLYYGIAKSDIPIMATNILSILLNIAMLVLKLRYNKR